jgi:hypothetical protein
VQAGTTPGVEPVKTVLPAELEAWCASVTHDEAMFVKAPKLEATPSARFLYSRKRPG